MANILKIYVDRSGRVYSTTNLSLNQCSNDNRIVIYYDTDVNYNYIATAFRQPDGTVTQKKPFKFSVDEEGKRYAYFDIPEDVTSFYISGKSGILVANLYFQYINDDGEELKSAVGNIRINVNYVDNASINPDSVSEETVETLYSLIGTLQGDFDQFKTGDVEVRKAIMDSKGNIIHDIYETIKNSDKKYRALDDKKLDKQTIEDQTERLNSIETNISTSNIKVGLLENTIKSTSDVANENKTEIKNIKDTTVSNTEFNKVIDERKAVEVHLQSQIDSIHQSAVFKDMVENASELTKAYAAANGFVEGDRVLVVSDNIIWKFTNGDFEKIGPYGAVSYSKSEIDTQHNEIKNTIPNKVSISDGQVKLSKGNTPISTEPVKLKTINGESIWGDGNIVYPVEKEFSATSELPVMNKTVYGALLNKVDKAELERNLSNINTALDEKQIKLIAGPNITITEDGHITVDTGLSVWKVPYETLEEIPDEERSSNIIYLYKPVNEDTYTEYLYVPDENRFEPFGKADIHLENYYTTDEVDAELLKKASNERVDGLDERITANAAKIETKVERENFETLTQTVNSTSSTLINLQEVVSNKAGIDYVDTNFAPLSPTKENFPSAYQSALKSGVNIKKIKAGNETVDLLGSGEIALTNMEILDLSEYYRKDEADPLFDEKVNTSDLNLLLDTKADKSELSVYRLASESYTKEEVKAAIEAADISDKLNDYYTIEQVDAKIAEADITDKLTEYATKTEVADAVASVDVSEQIRDFPTRTEVASTYLTQVNAGLTYVTKDRIDKLEVNIPTKVSALNNDIGFITKTDIPKDLSAFTNNPGYLTAESPAFKNKQDKLVAGTNIKKINGESILGEGNIKIVTDISHLETKTDAASKLATAKAYSDANKATLQTAINTNKDNITSLTTSFNTEKEDRIGAIARVDALITKNTTDVSNIQSGLTTEIAERKAADGTLDSKIDKEISDRKNANTTLDTKITTEISDRQSAVNTLDSKIDTEIEDRTADISSLDTRLTTEVSDRKTADAQTLADAKAYVDNAIGGEDGILEAIEAIREQIGDEGVNIMASINQNKADISGVRKDLTDEITARTNAVSDLNTRLTTESSTRASAVTGLQAQITTEGNTRATAITELQNDINSETAARTTAVTGLQNQITKEVEDRTTAVANIQTVVNTATSDVAALTTALETEVSERKAADNTLTSSVNTNTTNISTLTSNLSTEIQNRKDDDTALGTRITNLNTAFESHKTSADAEIISLDSKITAEAEARFAEDQNIYGVIESFTSGTDTKIKQVEDLVSAVDTRTQTAQKDISDHKIAADTKFLELDSKVGTKILFKNWTV